MSTDSDLPLEPRLRDALRQGDPATRVSDPSARTATGWNVLAGRIAGVTDALPRPRPFSARPSPRRWLSGPRLGGLSLGALAITGIWIASRGDIRHDVPATVHEYAATAGQTTSATLAPGLVAVLAPATRIVVKTFTPGAGMQITMTGQALFTVQHQSGVPVTVQTDDAVARVLGTTFFVRHYATDRATQIAVIDGRVAMQQIHGRSSATHAVVLAAPTLGTTNDSTGVTVRPIPATDRYTVWTAGTLIFDETPVRDILADVARAYGVDIHLADSTLAAHRLTWAVQTTHRTADDAIGDLSILLNLRVRHNKNVFTLGPEHGAGSHSSPLPSHLSPESSYGR